MSKFATKPARRRLGRYLKQVAYEANKRLSMPKCLVHDKLCIATERDAEEQARIIVSEGGIATTNAYWCEDCGYWHLTSGIKKSIKDSTLYVRIIKQTPINKLPL